MEGDELSKEIYKCMWCQKECRVEEGTWPQNDMEGEPMMDADFNNRSRDEFICYDCL